MAKDKKKKQLAYQDDVARKQPNVKEATGVGTKSKRKEEAYEEKQSLPGPKRNDRQQTDYERDTYNDNEVREAALESGQSPEAEDGQDVGARVKRQAKRKGQNPTKNQGPAMKTGGKAAKPVSRNSSRGRKPMKTKSTGSTRVAKKSRAKSR